MGKKLVIGWFTFTCCEDSSIVFIELMNKNYFKWKEQIEFRHCKILKSKNTLEDLDVAFVEGAISNDRDKARLEEIRAKSRYLVAIGACACTGGPSAQRNDFPDYLKVRIEPFLNKWDLYRRVLRLDEVVKVDDKVDGCPMVEATFLKVLDKYFAVFGVTGGGAGVRGPAMTNAEQVAGGAAAAAGKTDGGQKVECARGRNKSRKE